MSPTLEAETGPRWDRTVPVWAELGSEILCYVSGTFITCDLPVIRYRCHSDKKSAPKQAQMDGGEEGRI